MRNTQGGSNGSGSQTNNAGQKRSYNDISSSSGRNNTSSKTLYELEYLRLGVLATQHREFVDNVLCLTTSGLYRFQVLKPVEQLRRLLRVSDRQTFRNQVENLEICTVARNLRYGLILICSLPEMADETGTDIPFDAYAPGVPNDAAMGQSNFTGKCYYCCESRCRPREANILPKYMEWFSE